MKDHKIKAEVIRIIFGAESFKHFSHNSHVYADGEYHIRAPQRILPTITDEATIAAFPLRSNTLAVLTLLQKALPIFGVNAEDYRLSVTILEGIYQVADEMDTIKVLLADDCEITNAIQEIPINLTIAKSVYESKIAPFNPSVASDRNHTPQLLEPNEPLESVAIRLNKPLPNPNVFDAFVSDDKLVRGFEHLYKLCFQTNWEGKKQKSLKINIDFKVIHPYILKHSLKYLFKFLHLAKIKDGIPESGMMLSNAFYQIDIRNLYQYANSVDILLSGTSLDISLQLTRALYKSLIKPLKRVRLPDSKFSFSYLNDLISQNKKRLPPNAATDPMDEYHPHGAYYDDSDEEKVPTQRRMITETPFEKDKCIYNKGTLFSRKLKKHDKRTAGTIGAVTPAGKRTAAAESDRSTPEQLEYLTARNRPAPSLEFRAASMESDSDSDSPEEQLEYLTSLNRPAPSLQFRAAPLNFRPAPLGFRPASIESDSDSDSPEEQLEYLTSRSSSSFKSK